MGVLDSILEFISLLWYLQQRKFHSLRPDNWRGYYTITICHVGEEHTPFVAAAVKSPVTFSCVGNADTKSFTMSVH